MRLLRRPGRTKGQSMVEFALVLPIFLLIVLGLVDLGRAVFAYTSITNAVREAGRLAIVNQDTTLINQRGREQTAVAESTAPNLTILFKEVTPNVDPATNATCNPIRIGCLAVITYETTFTPITPIVGRVVFPSGVTLRAKTVLPVEFICPNPSVVASACPKQP